MSRRLDLDPKDPAVDWALRLAAEMEGLPRHMSIHVGGFTISDGPLIDLVAGRACEHCTAAPSFSGTRTTSTSSAS